MPPQRQLNEKKLLYTHKHTYKTYHNNNGNNNDDNRQNKHLWYNTHIKEKKNYFQYLCICVNLITCITNIKRKNKIRHRI